jgi:extracellular matrix protein 14
VFPGNYAFQAYESKAVADWATEYVKNGSKILGLLDLHSYSQQSRSRCDLELLRIVTDGLVLYPYSYSCRDIPPDLENLEELGFGLAKAIRVRYGEHYDVTSACEGTGFANFPGTTGSGSMIDYFYARLRVPYTFQIKLRDTGSYGFLLPKESIVPTGEEIFNLLKYFSQFISDDGSPTTVKAISTTSDEL